MGNGLKTVKKLKTFVYTFYNVAPTLKRLGREVVRMFCVCSLTGRSNKKYDTTRIKDLFQMYP